MDNRYMPEGSLIGTEQNREVFSSRLSLYRAIEERTVAEGKAFLCDRDMNLHVSTPIGNGIIPKEEIAYGEDGVPAKDIAVITKVGKPVSFVIKGYDGRTLLLSRREAQKRCYEEYVSRLLPGDVRQARVTHLEPFGAFLDVGCGYPALMSVDSISVSRISHPSDRLSEGDLIRCAIRSIDRQTRRVFASQRELYGTWEENASRFSPGQTVRGIIRSVEPYGIFVELAPNLAGLAEIKPPFDPESDPVGRFASVYIKSILPQRMKIKRVLIEVLERASFPPEAEYFVREETDHIDVWRYSPEGAAKSVLTDFGK